MFKSKRLLKNIVVMFTCLAMSIGCFSVVKADELNDNSGNSMQISSDADYLYITYEGSYTNYLNSAVNIGVEGANLNALSQIVINQNNSSPSSDLTILNSWYQPIDGASGTVTNSDGRMTYTIMVPWSTYSSFNPEEVTITWPAANQSVTIDYQGTIELPDEPEDPEEPSDPVNPDDPNMPVEPDPSINPGDLVGGDIRIDGDYTDWSGYPETTIGYGNNNDDANHHAQIVVQGDDLYVHVRMSDLYGSRMQIGQWNLSINGGQSVAFEIIGVDENGKVNWSSPYGQGVYNNLGVFINYNRESLAGNAAMTIHDDNHRQGDEVEYSINLDALASALGVTRDELKTITISNPNIGSTSITVAGTSTGTFIGIGITLLVTVVAYYVISRKIKREESK